MDAILYRIRHLGATVLDVVFPRTQRRMRAEKLSPEHIHIEPMTTLMLGQEIASLSTYASLKDLIQSLKYDRSSVSAHLLASALAEYLREDIASKRLFTTKEVLLIPVPLDAKRKRDRGYNQIGMVIDALPREFKDGTLSRIAAPLLERIRETKAQTKLSRSARLSNVAGAFAVSDPELVNGRIVYLIDDVATTGATLVNARTPLIHAGADVTLFALARA